MEDLMLTRVSEIDELKGFLLLNDGTFEKYETSIPRSAKRIPYSVGFDLYIYQYDTGSEFFIKMVKK